MEKGRIQVGIDKEFPMETKLSDEAKAGIRLRELTKNMPVEMLDTREKLEAWLDEEE